jgi:hypothetical protein
LLLARLAFCPRISIKGSTEENHERKPGFFPTLERKARGIFVWIDALLGTTQKL